MSSQKSAKTITMKKLFSMVVLVFSIIMTSFTFGGCSLFGNINTTSSMFDEAGNLRLVTPLLDFHESKEYYVHKNETTGEEEQVVPVLDVGPKSFTTNNSNVVAKVIASFVNATPESKSAALNAGLLATFTATGPLNTATNQMPVSLTLQRKTSDKTISAYPLEGLFVDSGIKYNIISAAINLSLDSNRNWTFGDGTGTTASLADIAEHSFVEEGSNNSRFINIVGNDITLLDNNVSTGDKKLVKQTYVDETTGSFSFELGYYWRNENVNNMFFDSKNNPVKQINNVKYDAAGYYNTPAGGESYDSALITTADRLNDANANIAFPNYMLLLDDKQLEIRLDNITYGIAPGNKLSPLINLKADIYYKTNYNNDMVWVKAEKSYFDIYQNKSNGMWMIRYNPRLENGTTSRVLKVRALSNDSNRGDSLYSGGVVFDVYRQTFTTYSNNSAYIDYGYLNYSDDMTPASPLGNNTYGGESRYIDPVYGTFSDATNPTKNYYFYDVQKKIDTTNSELRTVSLTGYFPQGKIVQVQRCLIDTDYAFQSWTTNTAAENGRVFTNTIYNDISYPLAIDSANYEYCLDYSLTLTDRGFVAVPTDDNRFSSIGDSIYFYGKNTALREAMANLFWDNLDTTTARGTYENISSVLTSVSHASTHNFKFYANYGKVNNFTLSGSIFNGDNLFDIGDQYLNGFNLTLYYYDGTTLKSHTYNPFDVGDFDPNGEYTQIINNRIITISGHNYIVSGLKYGDSISFGKQSTPAADDYAVYTNKAAFNFYSVKMVERDLGGYIKNVLEVRQPDNYVTNLDFYSDRTNVGIVGTQYKSNSNLQINIYVAGQDNLDSSAPAAVYNTSSGDLVIADGTDLKYEIIKTSDSYIDDFGYITTNVVIALQTESDSSIFSYNFETISSMNDVRFLNGSVLSEHYAYEHYYNALTLQYEKKPIMYKVTSLNNISVNAEVPGQTYKTGNDASGYTLYDFAYKEGDYYFYKIQDKYLPAPTGTNASATYTKYLVTKDHSSWSALYYTPVSGVARLGEVISLSGQNTRDYLTTSDGDYSFRFQETYYDYDAYENEIVITRDFFANSNDAYIVRTRTQNRTLGTTSYAFHKLYLPDLDDDDSTNSGFTMKSPTEIEFGGAIYTQETPSASSTSTVAKVYKTDMLQYETTYKLEEIPAVNVGDPVGTYNKVSKDINKLKSSYIYAYYDVAKASNGKYFLTAQLGIRTSIPQFNGGEIYNYKFYFEVLGDELYTDPNFKLEEQTAQSNFSSLLGGSILLGSEIVARATAADADENIRAFYLLMGAKLTANAYYYVKPLEEATDAYVSQAVETISTMRNVVSYEYLDGTDYTGDVTAKIEMSNDFIYTDSEGNNYTKDQITLQNKFYELNAAGEYVQVITSGTNAITINTSYVLVVYNNTSPTYFKQNPGATISASDVLKPKKYSDVKNNFMLPEGTTAPADNSYCYIYPVYSYNAVHKKYQLTFTPKGQTEAINVQLSERNLPFLDDLFGYQIIDSAAALKVEIKLDGGKYLAGFTLTNGGLAQKKENVELTRLRGSLYYKDYIICDAFETGVYTGDKLTLEYNYNKIVGLYLGTLRVMDYNVFNAIAAGSSQNIDTIAASSIWNTENAMLAKHLFPDSTVYVHDKLAYSVHSLALTGGITYTAEIDFTNNLSNKFKTIPLTYTGVDPDGNHLFTYNNGGYTFTFFVTASQFARIDDETGSTSDQVLDLINETAKNDEIINNFWTYAQYILSSNDFNSDFNAFDFESSLQVNAYNEELIIVTVKGGTVSGETVYVTSYSPTFITKHFDKNGTEIKQVISTEKQNVNVEKLVRSATLKNSTTDITILGKYTVTNNPDEPIVYPTYTTKLIYTTVIKINDQDETIEINKPGDGQVVKSQGGFDHYYSLDYTIPSSVIEGMPGVSLLDGPPYPNPVLYFSIRHIAGEQAVVNISLEVKSAFTIEVMGSKVDSDKDLLLDFSTFAFRDTLANLNYNYYMDNIYYVIEKTTFKPFSAYYEISLDKYNLLPENAKYMQDGHYYALWNSGEPLTIQNVGLNDDDPYIYFIDEMTADGAYTKNVYYLVDDGFGGYKMAKLTEETAYIWESSADSMKDLPIYDLHAYEQGKDGIIYFTSGNYSDDNTVCEGLEGLKAGATNKTDGVFDYTNVLIAGTVDAYRTDIKFNADGQEYLGYWQYNPVSTINAYDSSDAQFIAGKEAAVFVASPIVRVADPTAINTGVLYRFSHWLVYTRYNTEVMYLNRDYTYDSHGRYANTGAIMTFAPAENESGYFVFMPCYQRVLTIDVGTAVFDGPANLGGMVTFQYNGGEAVDATDPKDYDLYLLEYYKTTYGNKEGYFYTEVETTPYYVVTGFERVTMEGAAGTAYDYIKPIYAPADQYTIFKVAYDLPGTGTVYIYQYYDHFNKSYGTFGNSKTLNGLTIPAPGIEGFVFDSFTIDISPDPNLANGNAHITGVDLLQYITYIMLNRFNDNDGDGNDFTLDEVGDTFMLPTSIGPLLAPVTVAPDGFSIKYSTAQIFAIAEQYESFLKSLFKSFRDFFTDAAESMFGIKLVTMSELWGAIDYVSNYNNTEYVHYSKADELYNNLNYGYETSFVPESLADTEANYDAVSLRRLAYRDIATNTFYAVDQSVLTEKMISGGIINESFFLSGDKFAHLFTKDFLAISALASYETGNGYFANSENALLSGELYYNEDGQVNSTIQYKDTYFDRDSSVILTATPDYGYRFEGWYQAKFNEYTNTWQLSDVKLTDAAATYSDEIIAAVYNQVNQEFYYITEYYSELKQDLAEDGSVISYREYYLDEARTKKAIVPESMLEKIRGSYIIQNNKYVQIFYSAVRQEYYYDAALSLPVVNGHMYTRYTMTHYEVADRFYNPTRYTAIDDARGINTSSYAQNGFKHPTKFFTVAGETYNRYFRVKENGNVYVNGNTITIQKLHSNLRFVAKFIENYQLNNVTAAGDNEGIVVVDMMYYNTDALSGKRPTSNVRSDVYGNDLTIGNNASMATIDLDADCPAQGFGDDGCGAGFDPYYLTKAEDESQTLSTIVTDDTKYTFNFGYNWSQVSQDINGSVYPSTSYWVRHEEDSELSNENLYFDVNTTVFVMVKVKRGFSLSLHTLGFGSAAAYNVTPILEPNEDYLKNQTQGNLASGESQVDFFYYLFKITFDRNMDSSENDNAHLIRHPYRAQSVVGDILSGRDYDFYGNYFTLYDNEGFPIVNDDHGVKGYVEYNIANKTFNLLPWNYVRYQENSDGKKFWQRFGDEEYKAAENYELLRNNITNKATSITELLIEMSAFLKNEFAFYVDGVTTIDQTIQKNINGYEYELDLFANGGKITEPTTDMNTVFAAVQTITRFANPTGNKSVGPFTTGTTNFFNLSGLVIYTYTVQSMLIDSVNADGTINYKDDAPSITEMFAFSAGGSDGSMIMNANDVISITNPFEYRDVNPDHSTIMYFSQLYNSLPMLDLGGDVKSTTQTEDLSVVANTMLLLGGFGKLSPDNQTIEIKDPTTGQNFAFVGWYESKCQEIVNADGTITREWTNYELMSTDLITPYVSQANADTSIIALFKRIKDFEFEFNSKEVNITINGYQYDGSDFIYSDPDSDIITISGKVYVDQQLSITLSPNGGYRFNLDDSKQNIKIKNTTEYQNGFTYIDPILTTSFKNYLGKDIDVNDLIYNDICSFTINLSQFSQVGVNEADLSANANLPITLEIEMTPILLFFFEVEGYFVGGSWNNVTFELPGYFATQSNFNYKSWSTGKDDTNALMTIKVKGFSTLQVYGYFDRDHDGLEMKSSVSNTSTAVRHYYINNYNNKSTANLQSDNPGLDIHNGNLFPIRFMYEGSEAFLNDENHFALRPENVLYHIAAKIDAKHEIEIGSLFYSEFNAPTHLGIASDKIPDGLINFTFDGTRWISEGVQENNGYINVTDTQTYYFLNRVTGYFSVNQKFVEIDSNKYMFVGFEHAGELYTNQASYELTTNVYAKFVRVDEISINNASEFAHAGSYSVSGSTFTTSDATLNTIVDYNGQLYHVNGTALDISVTPSDRFIPTQAILTYDATGETITKDSDITVIDANNPKNNRATFNYELVAGKANVVINYSDTIEVVIKMLSYDSIDLTGNPNTHNIGLRVTNNGIDLNANGSSSTTTLRVIAGALVTLANLHSEFNLARLKVNGEINYLPGSDSGSTYNFYPITDSTVELCFVPYVGVTTYQTTKSGSLLQVAINSALFQSEIQYQYTNRFGVLTTCYGNNGSTYTFHNGTLLEISGIEQFTTLNSKHYAYVGFTDNINSDAFLTTESSFTYKVYKNQLVTGFPLVDFVFKHSTYSSTVVNVEITLGETINDKLKNAFELLIKYKDTNGQNVNLALTTELFSNLVGDVYKYSHSFTTINTPSYNFKVAPAYADKYTVTYNKSTNTFVVKGAKNLTIIGEIDGSENSNDSFQTVSYFNGKASYVNVSGLYSTSFDTDAIPVLTAQDIPGKSFAGWYINGEFKTKDKAIQLDNSYGLNILAVAKYLSTNSVEINRVVDGSLSTNSNLQVGVLGHFVTSVANGLTSEIKNQMLDTATTLKFTTRTNKDITLIANNTDEYVFLGWYSGSNLVSNSFVYDLTIGSNITLTAKFAKKFNISLIASTVNGTGNTSQLGGTISTNISTPYYTSENYAAGLIVNANATSGYTFAGFYVNGVYQVGSYNNPSKAIALSSTTGHLLIEAKFVKNFELDIRLAVADLNTLTDVQELLGAEAYGSITSALTIRFSFPDGTSNELKNVDFKNGNILSKQYADIPFGTKVTLTLPENIRYATNYNFAGYYIYNNEQASTSSSLYSYQRSFTFFVEDDTYIISKYADSFTAPYTNTSSYYFYNEVNVTKTAATAITLAADNTYVYRGETYLFVGWYSEVRDGIYPTRMIKVADNFTESISDKIIHKVAKFVKVFSSNFTVNYNSAPNINVYSFTANFFAAYDAGAASKFASMQVDSNAYKFNALLGTTYIIDAETIRGFGVSASTPDDTTFDRVTVTAGSGNNSHVYNAVMTGYKVNYTIVNGNYYHSLSSDTLITGQTSFVNTSNVRDSYIYTFNLSTTTSAEYKIIITDIYGNKRVERKTISTINPTISVTIYDGELVTIVLSSKDSSSNVEHHYVKMMLSLLPIICNYRSMSEYGLAPFYQFYASSLLDKTVSIIMKAKSEFSIDTSGSASGEKGSSAITDKQTTTQIAADGVTEIDYTTITFEAKANEGYAMTHIMWKKGDGAWKLLTLADLGIQDNELQKNIANTLYFSDRFEMTFIKGTLLNNNTAITSLNFKMTFEDVGEKYEFAAYFVKLVTVQMYAKNPEYMEDVSSRIYLMYNTTTDDDLTFNWNASSEILTSSLGYGEGSDSNIYEHNLVQLFRDSGNSLFNNEHEKFVNVLVENQTFDLTYDAINAMNDQVVFSTNNSGSFIQVVVNYSELRTYRIQVNLHAATGLVVKDSDYQFIKAYITINGVKTELIRDSASQYSVIFKDFTCHLSDLATIRVVDESTPQRFYMDFYSNNRDSAASYYKLSTGDALTITKNVGSQQWGTYVIYAHMQQATRTIRLYYRDFIGLKTLIYFPEEICNFNITSSSVENSDYYVTQSSFSKTIVYPVGRDITFTAEIDGFKTSGDPLDPTKTVYESHWTNPLSATFDIYPYRYRFTGFTNAKTNEILSSDKNNDSLTFVTNNRDMIISANVIELVKITADVEEQVSGSTQKIIEVYNGTDWITVASGSYIEPGMVVRTKFISNTNEVKNVEKSGTSILDKIILTTNRNAGDGSLIQETIEHYFIANSTTKITADYVEGASRQYFVISLAPLHGLLYEIEISPNKDHTFEKAPYKDKNFTFAIVDSVTSETVTLNPTQFNVLRDTITGRIEEYPLTYTNKFEVITDTTHPDYPELSFNITLTTKFKVIIETDLGIISKTIDKYYFGFKAFYELYDFVPHINNSWITNDSYYIVSGTQMNVMTEKFKDNSIPSTTFNELTSLDSLGMIDNNYTGLTETGVIVDKNTKITITAPIIDHYYFKGFYAVNSAYFTTLTDITVNNSNLEIINKTQPTFTKINGTITYDSTGYHLEDKIFNVDTIIIALYEAKTFIITVKNIEAVVQLNPDTGLPELDSNGQQQPLAPTGPMEHDNDVGIIRGNLLVSAGDNVIFSSINYPGFKIVGWSGYITSNESLSSFWSSNNVLDNLVLSWSSDDFTFNNSDTFTADEEAYNNESNKEELNASSDYQLTTSIKTDTTEYEPNKLYNKTLRLNIGQSVLAKTNNLKVYNINDDLTFNAFYVTRSMLVEIEISEILGVTDLANSTTNSTEVVFTEEVEKMNTAGANVYASDIGLVDTSGNKISDNYASYTENADGSFTPNLYMIKTYPSETSTNYLPLYPYVYTNCDSKGNELPDFVKIPYCELDIQKSEALSFLLYDTGTPVYVIDDGSPYFEYMYQGEHLIQDGAKYKIKFDKYKDNTDTNNNGTIDEDENNVYNYYINELTNIQTYSIIPFTATTSLSHIYTYIYNPDYVTDDKNNPSASDKVLRDPTNGYALKKGLIFLGIGQTNQEINEAYANDPRVSLNIDFATRRITVRVFLQSDNGSYPVIEVRAQSPTMETITDDDKAVTVIIPHSLSVVAADPVNNTAYASDFYRSNVFRTDMPTTSSHAIVKGFYQDLGSDSKKTPKNENMRIKVNYLYSANIVTGEFTDENGESASNGKYIACHDGKKLSNPVTIEFLYQLYDSEYYFNDTVYQIFNNNFANYNITIIQGTETYLSKLDEILRVYFGNVGNADPENINHFFSKYQAFGDYVRDNSSWWKSNITYRETDEGRKNLYATCFNVIIAMMNALTSYGGSDKSFITEGYLNFDNIFDSAEQLNLKSVSGVYNLYNILLGTNFTSNSDINSFFRYKTINVKAYFDFLKAKVYNNGSDVRASYLASNFSQMLAVNYNYGDTIRVDTLVNAHKQEQYNESISKAWWIFPEIVWWASKGYMYLKQLTECNFTITSGLTTYNPKVTSALESSEQQENLSFFQAFGQILLSPVGDMSVPGTNALVYTTTTPNFDSFKSAKSGGNPAKLHMTLNGDDDHRIYYEAREWDRLPVGQASITVVSVVGTVVISVATLGTGAVALMMTGAILTAVWLTKEIIDKFPQNSPLRNLFS